MMYDNHTYNLLEQLSEELKSLWRIKKNYPEDAGSCEHCKTIWKDLEGQKENNVEKLTELLKSHLNKQ